MSTTEIYHEVWIDERRDDVYRVITTREGLDSWWGPVIEVGQEPGSEIAFDHGHGQPLRMRIVVLEPGVRAVWESVTAFKDPKNPATEWLGTRIEFALEDGHPTGFASIDTHFSKDPFTILHFRHSGWPEKARWLGFCNYAWGVTLLGLSSALAESD